MKLLSFLGFFSFLFVFSFSCKQETSSNDNLHSTQSPQLKEVLDKAIKKAGGLERWNQKKEYRFEKTFTLFEASGNIEKSVIQNHHYTYFPDTSYQIDWIENGLKHQLISKDGQIQKTINGNVDQSNSQSSLKNELASTIFVANLPFNLLDASANLSYEGLDTLQDQTIVHVLKATYNSTSYTHHTTPDTWWHFFHYENFAHEGYRVQHKDHISFIRNTKTIKSQNLTLINERSSWRVDSVAKILYLRAVYKYKNYHFLW